MTALRTFNPLLLTLTEEAALLNCSPRKVKTLRATDPSYPKGRQCGGTVYRTFEELRAYVAALPTVEARPEPEKLKRGKAKARIAPKPEVWPPPLGAAERMARASGKRTSAKSIEPARPE